MTDLACPKCIGPLRFGGEPRGPVGSCYDCWAIWIDTPRLNELRKEYPVGRALYEATRELKPEETEPTDLLCPSCPDGKLVRQTIRGVELEWCQRCHGICLDQGERERLFGLALKTRPVRTQPAPAVNFNMETPGMVGVLAVGDLLEGLASLISGIWD
jgi:Zn-finger nucleic acid-binding protein